LVRNLPTGVSSPSEARSFDALLGNGLAMLELGAEDPLVGGHGLVEIFDGDSEVMDPARLHAGDATRG
jgi:hypothetical protein